MTSPDLVVLALGCDPDSSVPPSSEGSSRKRERVDGGERLWPVKKSTANWLASADYDLQTAEAMLKSERYLYVVFMCHLAIEKTLKALYAETRPEHPPRTHDLLFLVRELRLSVPKAHRRLVGAIANASVPTRYPEDLPGMVRQYPRRTVCSYLARTRKALQWLRKQPPLAET